MSPLLQLLLIVLCTLGVVAVIGLVLRAARPNARTVPAGRRADGAGGAAAAPAAGWNAPPLPAVEPAGHVPWIALVGSPGAPTGALARSLPEVRRRGVGGAVPRLTGVDVRLTDGGALLDGGDRLFVDDDGPARWTGWLRELARQRGRRPLDAVVVVVPARDLVGAEPERSERLLGLAQALRDLLWRAERETGLRLPVTLLVAADDTLAGAGDLADLLASRPDRGSIGWAARDPATAVDRETVEAGLDDAGARLARLVTDLLARGEAGSDTAAAGRLSVLPTHFAEVARGVGQLADQLLLPIAYHEPIQLRGVHLAVPAGGATDGFRFVRELFARRIFVEIRLAVPARVAAGLRRRQLRVAQLSVAGAALLAVVGWSWLALDRGELAAVREALAQLARDLRAAASAPGDQELVETTAIDLINALSNLSTETVESNLAPTSHLTGATDRVVDAIRVGYRFALLQATARQLQEIKVGEALAGLDAAATGALEARLSHALDRLGALRGQIAAYRTLNQGRDVRALADVVAFAFEKELPPSFTERSNLYAEALRGAVLPEVATDRIAAAVTPALRRAFDRLADARYVDAEAVRALERMTPLAQATAAELSMARFPEALIALGRLRAALDRNPAWLTEPDGTVPAALRPLVERVEGLCPAAADALCLTAPGFAAELRADLADTVTEQRRFLRGQALFGVSPAIVEGADGALELARPLAEAAAAFDDYFRDLSLATLASSRGAGPAPAIETDALAWDPSGLERLLAITAHMVVVDTGRFADLPSGAVATARAVAEVRLTELFDAQVRAAAQRAHGLDPSREGERLAAAFRLAAPSLRVLHGRFRQLGMPALAARLDDVVRPQAVGLLRRADRALGREGLYQLYDPTLISWDGVEPVSFAAFNVFTPGELPGLLARWREDLARVNETYARAAVAYLAATGGAGAANPRVRRWDSIARRLETYDRQAPANTLVQLERAILQLIPDFTRADCEALPSAPGGGDFFREVHQQLVTALKARCGELELDDLLIGYAELAEAFNAELAGRYPFAAPDGPPAAMADPATIRRFFDGPAAELDRMRTAAENRPAGARVARFLNQLAAARAALAPLLAPPADLARLAYDVEVDWRPFPQLDRGGDQIIEGRIAGGGAARSSFEPETLRWTFGETFELGVRWANRAPLQPAPAPGLRVRGREVVIADRSPWALFRLAQRWRADAGGAVAAADDVLRLDVPVVANPDRGEGGRDDFETARLYLRLKVSALVPVVDEAPRRTPVRLAPFPPRAPRLEPAIGAGLR